MNTSESISLLSDVLLDDERIVTTDEREFLTELLRRSENNPNQSNPAVTQAIAEIAGEIVVRRAGSLMADSILRKLTGQSSRNYGEHRMEPGRPITSSLPPKPPTPGPPTPGTSPRGNAAQNNRLASLPKPPTPGAPSPGLTSGGVRAATAQRGILNLAIEESAELLPPRCIVLEEFLVPAELNTLLSYTLSQEHHFMVSEVISPGVEPRGTVEFEYRRSHVLMDLGPHYQRLIDRLQAIVPRFLPKLGIEPFPVSQVEAQITASKDGDFFHWHNDNGHEEVSARKITFVYFFHREPKAFEGGELRIQSPVTDNAAFGSGNYYTIVPRQNQLVLFDSSLTHEIAPVKCSSGKFSDSRFTVNGWVRC